MKVYLDIYFILNLIMNFFLLSITGVLRQKRISPWRCFLCSACSSLFSTVIYVWSLISGKGCLLLDLFGIPVLVRAAYPYINRRILFQDSVFLGGMALLTGGCLHAMYALLTVCFPLFLQEMNGSAFASFGLITAGVFCLSVVFLLLGKELLHQVQYQKNIFEAILFHRGREYRVRVLQDTGNNLISPYTGERVAVISQNLASKIQLESEQAGIYIPYHSIGGSGILPAYRLERLEWQGNGRMEHFLAAVSRELKEQEIQMIVNNS